MAAFNEVCCYAKYRLFNRAHAHSCLLCCGRRVHCLLSYSCAADGCLESVLRSWFWRSGTLQSSVACAQVRDNLSEGLRFYASLQEALTALAQHVGDFCLTRRIQR